MPVYPCARREVAYAPLSVGGGLRFDTDVVVYGSADPVLASDVAFRCSEGDVAQQELDLLEFSAAVMAELGTGAPQKRPRRFPLEGTHTFGRS